MLAMTVNLNSLLLAYVLILVDRHAVWFSLDPTYNDFLTC